MLAIQIQDIYKIKFYICAFLKTFINNVDINPFVLYNKSCPRGVAQLGARVVWDHEVAGSIPVTPTTKN